MSTRERIESLQEREWLYQQIKRDRAQAKEKDKEREISGAGLAPFKSVLNVLLRHQQQQQQQQQQQSKPSKSLSQSQANVVQKNTQFSPLFESVIRPSLQKISDMLNEPLPPLSTTSVVAASTASTSSTAATAATASATATAATTATATADDINLASASNVLGKNACLNNEEDVANVCGATGSFTASTTDVATITGPAAASSTSSICNDTSSGKPISLSTLPLQQQSNDSPVTVTTPITSAGAASTGTATVSTSNHNDRERKIAKLRIEAEAEERRLRAEAEQKRQETKDLVTVLIAALTALDQHTDGELTSELATTMMGYMMEELDGNMF
jgi:hypothetical protein